MAAAWSTTHRDAAPSPARRVLLAALALDALVGTLVSSVGIPGLAPLPWRVTLAVFGYAMRRSLGVNGLTKAAPLRWRGAASI